MKLVLKIIRALSLSSPDYPGETLIFVAIWMLCLLVIVFGHHSPESRVYWILIVAVVIEFCSYDKLAYISNKTTEMYYGSRRLLLRPGLVAIV